MRVLLCGWFVSSVGDAAPLWKRRGRLHSPLKSLFSSSAISAAYLATPLVQRAYAKGVPGVACEYGRVDANRGAFS
jgi:hypothetical protein